METSTCFVSSVCSAHFSYCQLYDFCIVLIVSLFIFTCHISSWLSSSSASDWSVTYSCAVYTCHMKCVRVCVRVCIQCITVPTETLLQKLNHDTMFTHNAVRHSCTVWCQCICPQCSSVLVLMNLISDQPTLLHDTTVYFDMFFIACTVFSLFLYSFNHINSCVWSMLSTTTGVSDSN